jgi:putative heme-binding domain-containing protein
MIRYDYIKKQLGLGMLVWLLHLPLMPLALAVSVVEPTGVNSSAAELLGEVASVDADLQRSLLAGVVQGLSGTRRSVAPNGWATLAPLLQRSELPAVQTYAWYLSAVFGDEQAAITLRKILLDATAPAAERRRALKGLLHVHAPNLAADLLCVLDEVAMRSLALRALGEYEDPLIAQRLLADCHSWSIEERRDALHTLASRASSGRAVILAITNKQLALSQLSASMIRQLALLKDPQITEFINKNTTGVNPDTLAEVERLKGLLSPQVIASGDRAQGQALFEQTCAQCHALWGSKGNLGPELTGLNRPDLDWVVKNVLDPSAIMGGDQQYVVARMRDGRVVIGMQREDTLGYYSLQNESGLFMVLKSELSAYEPSARSTMPNGLFRTWTTAQLADFLRYFQGAEPLNEPNN